MSDTHVGVLVEKKLPLLLFFKCFNVHNIHMHCFCICYYLGYIVKEWLLSITFPV